MSIYNAKWIKGREGCESPFFRKSFAAAGVKKAVLEICGLGWHEAYINGRKITDAVLAPGVSTYAQVDPGKSGKGYPWKDRMNGTRVYFLRHDVTGFVKNGKNLLSVQLGNGFWNQTMRLGEGDFSQGAPRLAFSLRIELENGLSTEIRSDEATLCGNSGIIENNLYFGEVHDLSVDGIHTVGFDESAMEPSFPADALEGELCLWNAPYDKVVRTTAPVLLFEKDGKKFYDAGEDIAGWVAFDTETDGEVNMEFAEELRTDGQGLEFCYSGGAGQIQKCRYIGDGKRHTDVHPHFSWQGFRYFSVQGDAENLRVDVVHTALRQTGDFTCDNEIVNTVLDNYKRSQLTNLHGCVPSDCPHRERLGYTGDGQITSETVMHMFDAREMYKKWMQDIVDGQCADTGRVQNTAPFAGGGGGPAGWGGAIFIVPFTYYKMYGDDSLLVKYSKNMDMYFDYLETKCDDSLLSRSEPGCWFLGDWCWVGCSPKSQDIPARFVSTAYLVKFYDIILMADKHVGLGIDRAKYKQRRASHVKAIIDNFYDEKTGDFAGNSFGANAFAIDINLGDERTFNNLAEKYENAGGFDTGIFATEFLVRILGEKGRTDLVYKLLTSEKHNRSFYSMYKQGATTLWEDWDGHSSHNHPMFGGCFKALWTCFLGIKPTSPGYRTVKIEPCDIEGLGNMSGYIETVNGRLSVSLIREKSAVRIIVSVPEGCMAELEF